ncbi:MAG TPA: glycosyltransferase family 39 protein [Ktedonobacteraceae bacterium]|nr:glycosyltransferase family 39 protein [Ktedonobacteraceae bacterium]
MSTSTILDDENEISASKTKTTSKSFFHWQTLLFYALALILLATGIWMRLHNLGLPFDRDSYDEGVYWQSLRAMSTGHTLYQQIFYSQPPFFLLSVFPIYLLFGQTIWAARLGIALISLFGLLGALLLGKTLGGRIAAIAAMLLLLVNPLYLAESRILQAEAPSTALALLAVGLAYLWWKRPEGTAGLCFAALTAFTLALGILAKFFAVVELVPVGLLMVAYVWRISVTRDNPQRGHGRKGVPLRWEGARPLLIGIAVFIVTSALVLLPFAGSFSQMWQGAVSFHTDASRVLSYSRAGNKGMIENFLLGSPLTYAALLGTVVALLRRDWRVIPLVAWFGATTVMLWRYAPLFPHHLIVLVPPMVALAAIGMGPVKLEKKASVLFANVTTALSLVMVLVVGVINGRADMSYYRADQAQTASESTQGPIRVAKELQQVLQPGQFVITDAQFLVGLADRNTPPSLVDTSNVRIQTGYVTSQQLIEQAQQPEVHAVLFYTGRLATQAAFHTWVKQHFRLVHDYGGGRELWIKP